jgi:hypothetical protein
VTITGTHLGGALTVTFGSKAGTILTDIKNRIRVKVPVGAKTSKITVFTKAGDVKSVTKFKVT